MIAWMAYAALVGAIVAAGGLAMEQLAAAIGRPRRMAWLAALALGVAIPLAGGWGTPVAAPVEETSAESEPADRSLAGDLWRAMPAVPVPRDRAAGRIALLAWGVGTLAALVVLAGVLVVVARGRRRWERRRVLGADLYVSRRFGPALVGVARPRVVIPAWVTELEPGASDAIIRHELEHARAGDHLALLYGGLVAAAFPWSPAIWWMYRRLRAAVELDCDQRVLASGIGVADYGDVLLGAGSRSRGHWGFAPAMGQPRSLLERRLKTMSEKRRRLNAGRAALLAAVAVGAVMVACDTPVPTEVREAFEEVTADQRVALTEAEMERRSVRLRLLRDFVVTGRSRVSGPVVYLDGVRVPGPWETSDGEDPLSQLDPHDIATIEVLKGAAARELYGDEAAMGVIEIFTKAAEYEREPHAEGLVATEQGRVEPVAGWQVEELVVTVPPLVEPVAELEIQELVVTGQARARSVAEQRAAKRRYELQVQELVVAGQAQARRVAELEAAELVRELEAQELVVAGQVWGEPVAELQVEGFVVTGQARPVVFVDGVRADEAGLDQVLRDIGGSDRIDRIEIEKGEAAERLYGSGAAHGVIHIYTRR
ncbi:MAG: TonB-dependent receptor plug domain-containing protein [Gemmatimonadetes bacterium]|nr:TonB-dependent receptor plug domain-containing protein [Gemmatimonadota bacterium]